MEDKILIKSETNKVVKNILRFAPIVYFGLAILFFVKLITPTEMSYYNPFTNRYYTRDIIGLGYVFRFGEYSNFFIWLVISVYSFISAIVTGVIYLANKSCELQITENSVKGKTLFGKAGNGEK